MAVVRHKDVPDHLESNGSSHLMLAMNRMLEYQDLFSQFQTRITDLEKENSTLKSRIQNLSTGVVTANTTCEAIKTQVANDMAGAYSKLVMHTTLFSGMCTPHYDIYINPFFPDLLIGRKTRVTGEDCECKRRERAQRGR